jgi:regulator of cell morphogenesis and NO signaling
MKIQKFSINANESTIADIVVQDYRTAQVFKKFGLDFCCGGKKTITDACKKKEIDQAVLISELETAVLDKPQISEDHNTWDLDKLSDHIINTHHNYVKESLPMLDEFSAKVARVHGDAHPEVVEISDLFFKISEELSFHMHKEESILFPYIAQIAIAQRNDESLESPPFGSIQYPINKMEDEHDDAGDIMTRIQKLSSNYMPPEYACNTYRVLYAKLNEFAEDLYQHIHLENNILFPKAIKLEKELLS